MSQFVASTNYAAVVRPLQVLVMGVAILFFARVIRAAQVEARPPEDATTGRRKKGGSLALEFIEPIDRTGERVQVENAITVGRSSDCDLQLQDNFLSSRHARLANDDGDLSIEDLGSTNGTYVNQELVKGRVHLSRGDIVQIGGVLFEVVR